MAVYKYKKLIVVNENVVFDYYFKPGEIIMYSGIYRCEICGYEIVAMAQNALPDFTHHEHHNKESVKWRLIVASVYNF